MLAWACCDCPGVHVLNTFVHVMLIATPVSCTILLPTCEVLAPCRHISHRHFLGQGGLSLSLSKHKLGKSCTHCVVVYYLVSMHVVLVFGSSFDQLVVVELGMFSFGFY